MAKHITHTSNGYQSILEILGESRGPVGRDRKIARVGGGLHWLKTNMLLILHAREVNSSSLVGTKAATPTPFFRQFEKPVTKRKR